MDHELADAALDDNVALLNRLLDASDFSDDDSSSLRALDRSVARASFAQRGLWFLNGIDPDCVAYHVPLRFRVDGRLDKSLLARTVEILQQRHPSLRTTFAFENGDVVQRIAAHPVTSVHGFDLRNASEAQKQTSLAEIERDVFFSPFDLTRGPLFRLAWVILGERQETLLMCLHHNICDAWSGLQLARDFGNIYASLANRSELAPAGRFAYADFSEWQHEAWAGGEFAGQVEYWKQKLTGVKPVTLPATGKRPGTPTMRGAKLPIALSAATTVAFENYCRDRQATLFMGLLAAFKVVLMAQTGQTDVVVGSAMAGRELPEVQDIVGFFINTVVLRTELGDCATFDQALAKVRETMLGAYTHPDVSFEKLVEILKPVREPGQNPLFAVSFTLNEHPASLLDMPGATVTVTDPNLIASGRAKFDLAVHLWKEGEGIGGVLEYSTDLYEAPAVARVARRLEQLVAQLTERPSTPLVLTSLPTLDEADRARLAAWNETAGEWKESTFVEAFDRNVLAQPTAVAVADGEGETTYGELGLRVNRVAQKLQECGVRLETPVAVFAERSTALVTGFAGVLKSGGAFLPLDPRQPLERLRQIVTEARPALVLADESNFAAASQLGLPALPLESFSQGEVGNADLPRPSLSNLAYLIYTSGSTGTPKGVAVEHRSFYHLIDYTIVEYGLKPSDRAGLITSIGFDPAVWELGSFLAAGATLVMGSEETRLSPERTQRWMLEERLDVIYMAAPLLDPLLELPWPSVTRLRLVLTGGDRLRRNPPATIPFRLINLYGPAECTVNATSCEIPRGDANHRSAVIGKPLRNFKVHLLDSTGRPVAPGTVGEIYLEGVGVARGYYRNPQLTAAAYLPNPFSAEPGSRLYRTGDLARWLEDGNLFIHGRADGQVKIRGMRIEVGEIEAALCAYPEVSAAVVVPTKRADAETSLAGYYVAAAPIAALKSFLRERLPESMVPKFLVRVSAIPHTPNGKIDFAALPEPITEITPAGKLEGGWQDRIAEIWCEVLGLAYVGPDTNFFDAGGHSLLLAAVQAKLAGIPGGEVRLIDLFRHTTVRSLAEWMERGERAVIAPAATGSSRAEQRRKRLGELRNRMQ